MSEKQTGKPQPRQAGGSPTSTVTAGSRNLPQRSASVKDAGAQAPPDTYDPSYPLTLICPAPDNPRREVGDIAELTESVRESGLIHALVCVWRTVDEVVALGVDPTEAMAYYADPTTGLVALLVAGHRRRTACLEAGLEHVPVVFKTMDESGRKIAMIVENVQRSDLKPSEECAGFTQLERLGLSQRDIAKRTGRSQGHVSKRLSLAKLPWEVLDQVDGGRIRIEVAHQMLELDSTRLKKALEIATKRSDGPQAWELANLKREQESDERKKASIAEAKKKGWKLFESEPSQVLWRIGTSWGNLNLDAKAHESEPCHAVLLTYEGTLTHCCTDRTRHPEAKTPGEIANAGHHELAAKREAERVEAKRLEVARLAKGLRPVLTLSDKVLLTALCEVVVAQCYEDDFELAVAALELKLNGREPQEALLDLIGRGKSLLAVLVALLFANRQDDERIAPILMVMAKLGHELNDWEEGAIETWAEEHATMGPETMPLKTSSPTSEVLNA